VHTLARIGFVTKGAVYCLIAALALDAARFGRHPEGSAGAVRHIRDLPFGSALLLITAVGLFGYGLWRVVQAFFDPDHEGSGASAIITRVGHFGAGLMYGGLSVAAFQLALGEPAARGDGMRTWIGRLMMEPFGHVLVIALGIGISISGGAQIVSAVSGRFTRYLDHLRMSARQRTWVENMGRVGISARGIVFITIGVLLVRAGLDSNPSEATGMPGALSWLRASSHGGWLLSAIAGGLACYGLYMIACARFRHLGRV
jgi:hypothetical protein